MSEAFVWTPSERHLTESRVARFMRRHGITDRESLIERCSADPEWFWKAVVDDLELTFFEPFTKVRDLSQGAPWARWFVDGRLNLVHNVLDRHADVEGGERLAVLCESEDGAVVRWSYRELREETCRFANVLRGLGVAPGDRVGLFLPLYHEAVAAFLAVARLGSVAVPIFSGFGAEAVAARLNDSGAVALITADGVRRKGRVLPIKPVADAALALTPTVRHVIVTRRAGNTVGLTPGRDHPWGALRANASGPIPCMSVDSEHPFLIAYTSGTTGRPKGAVHVHGGFLAKIAQEVAFHTDMRPDDRLFWLTDLGWIMGPWEIVGGLASGGAIVLYDGAPDHPGPDRLWALVARHAVTILGVSPTLIRSLMRHGEGWPQSHDLSTLRILGSTGETWNPDPWLWYFEHVGGTRCPIINISGGTEVGACFLAPLPITPLKPCTLGGPALGMDVDVVDPSGAPLRGGVGELVCRQPWPAMTRGLWNDPDRYLETYWSRFPGLWTHGDWASVDADGLWFLHGRSDDTLNIAGKRIGPAELESLLVADDNVAEAAAIGVPDEVKGEAAWCFVVLKPGVTASEEIVQALRDRVTAALGKPFQPKEFRFVSELPRTRNAKILRRALRARLLGSDPGDLSNLENPSALDAVASILKPSVERPPHMDDSP